MHKDKRNGIVMMPKFAFFFVVTLSIAGHSGDFLIFQMFLFHFQTDFQHELAIRHIQL